ncbi:MAG TPA: hypothetical protein VNE83_00890 [Terriglobales bacterium]|nr:hypothetical protein [Terriglobales bacterium]
MTLLDAPQYNERRDRIRRNIVITGIVIILVAVGGFAYWPRYIARRTVDHFMDSLIDKNFQEAYAIWQANPRLYPMDTFMQDWGPGSKWGIIKTYKIVQLGPPQGGHSSGLVALVEINAIAGTDNEARIWIQNGTRELSFYQF